LLVVADHATGGVLRELSAVATELEAMVLLRLLDRTIGSWLGVGSWRLITSRARSLSVYNHHHGADAGPVIRQLGDQFERQRGGVREL